MKVVCSLMALALAVTALPMPEEERVNGVNGWYVPELDGSHRWVTLEEGEQMLADLEQREEAKDNQEIMARISSVPVTFYLFTNKNPTKAQIISETSKSIDNSDFDARNPTKFVIHGWTQSHNARMYKEVRAAWLSRGKYNVIIVDWARARSEYINAVSAIPKSGQKVASLIDYLVENYDMDLDETEVIGHSLGAHVAGHTGKNVKNGKLHAIVGLDTAMPLFSYNKPNKRLSADDAQYVESIHTNGGNLGFLQPIGKGAFYPNGGKHQPGCGLDLDGMCAHQRSVAYYAEAVSRDSFPSMRCGDYEQAVQSNCDGSYSSVKMAAESNAYAVTGEYFVPVNSASPFGFAFGA